MQWEPRLTIAALELVDVELEQASCRCPTSFYCFDSNILQRLRTEPEENIQDHPNVDEYLDTWAGDFQSFWRMLQYHAKYIRNRAHAKTTRRFCTKRPSNIRSTRKQNPHVCPRRLVPASRWSRRLLNIPCSNIFQNIPNFAPKEPFVWNA